MACNIISKIIRPARLPALPSTYTVNLDRLPCLSARSEDALINFETTKPRTTNPTMAGSEALLQRLRSYSPISWFGKPPELSAPRCAALGWRNTGPDSLTCDTCGGKILCLLPPTAELGGSAVASYATQLTIAHDPACPWRKQPASAASAASALRFPLLPTATLIGSFRQRLAQLQQLEATPPVSAGVLHQLVAAAQQLDPALLQALAGLADLPLEALLQQQAPAGSSSSSSQAVLRKQQAQALLALCGWQVGQLLPPQLAADAARQSAFGVSHLLAPRSSSDPLSAAGTAPSATQGPASLQASIGCGQATLLCDLCGSRVGLWQFSCSGPFYAQQLASRAAAVVAAAESAVAAESPQPEPPAADAGHATAGGPEQQQQQPAAAASPAVAASLQHTIAGGSLLSPSAAVPAAPGFSRGSPALARASSGGFFRSPSPRAAGPFGMAPLPAFGSSPGFHLAAGSPGFGAGAASGGPFGAAAAAAGGFGEAAGGANDAAGPVFGISALKQEEQRAKQQHVAAVVPAGGASGAGGMRSAGSGFLRSPSSSRAAADGGASSSSSSACFDPVAQHRSWCPWVHCELGQAAPVAGGAAAGTKGSLWHQGWSSTLLALLEEREDQQLRSGEAPAAGGAGDSAAVMATARQVLDALG